MPPKVAKRSAENSEGSLSPSQMSKASSRDKKILISDDTAASRLPRAAKTKADKKITETYVPPVKKTRGKLARSNSDENIAQKTTTNGIAGQRRMRRSKSVEPFYQDGVPPAKKMKNGAVKKPVAKKNVGKKAGTETKGNPRGKATKEIEPVEEEEEVEDEERSEEEQPAPPLIAKKAYTKPAAKKVAAPMKKPRGKKAANSVEEKEDEVAAEEAAAEVKNVKDSKDGKEEAKGAKVKKGKTPPVAKSRGKKAAPAAEATSHSKDMEVNGNAPESDDKMAPRVDSLAHNGKSNSVDDNTDRKDDNED